MNHQLVMKMRQEQRLMKQIKIKEVINSIKEEQSRPITKYSCFNKKSSQLQNPIYSINFYRPRQKSNIQHDKSIDQQLSTDLINPSELYKNTKRSQKLNRSMKNIKYVLNKSRELINTTKNDETFSEIKKLEESQLLQRLHLNGKKQYQSKMQSIEERMKFFMKSKIQSSTNSEAVFVTQQDIQEDRRQEILNNYIKRQGLQNKSQKKPYIIKTESTSMEKKKGKSLSQNKINQFNQMREHSKESTNGGYEEKLQEIQGQALKEKNNVFKKQILSKSSQFFKGISQQFSDYSKILQNDLEALIDYK